VTLIRRLLNPRIDFVFRILFGSEANKDLLISLINSVVGPHLHIVDVVIKNPFNLAAYRGSKETILDIKAMDQDGTWYDIEMQTLPHVFYGKRAIYYAAKVYVDQLAAADDYSSLNPTIGIHFLDFNYFDDDRMVRQFVFKDMDTNEHPDQLRFLQLYFIEMRKFRKDWPQISTALDRWVAFLTRAERLKRNALPAALRDEPAIVKAVSELERMGADPVQREIYETEVQARMVDAIQIKTAEERGMQLGIQRERNLMIRLITRQIGTVPPNIATCLDTLTPDQIDDLGDALFDLNSYADVEDWLSRQPRRRE